MFLASIIIPEILSDFGVELDSLSDFISFGIAQAIVDYLWSKSLFMESSWAVVIFYAICSSSRLAKFNTEILAVSGEVQVLAAATRLLELALLEPRAAFPALDRWVQAPFPPRRHPIVRAGGSTEPSLRSTRGHSLSINLSVLMLIESNWNFQFNSNHF